MPASPRGQTGSWRRAVHRAAVPGGQFRAQAGNGGCGLGLAERVREAVARTGGMRGQTAAPAGLPRTNQVRQPGRRRNVGCGAARRQAPLQRTPAQGRCEGRNTSGPAAIDEPRCGVAGERIAPQEPVMPKDQDFKRLVRTRMDHTGERYTQARAALAAERAAPDPLVSDRTRSVVGQLSTIELAEPSRRYLERLPEPERRAAAIEGLRHQDWRVRRTSALLRDRVDLTAESAAALTRALDDE